jgi:hypothetical protein
MKNILVPTDFSLNTLNALNYAVHLFEEDECTFYLLNAFQKNETFISNLFYPKQGKATYNQIKNESKIGLAALKDKIALKDDNTNHLFKVISYDNTLSEAIKQTIEINDISIIILGIQAETNEKNTLLGSNKENIMAEIKHCQILLVPPNYIFSKNIKKEFVYATDLQKPFDSKELESVIRIATNIKAIIRVLHILENGELTSNQENNKRDLMNYLKGLEPAFHTLTNENVDTGIQSFIERRGSDILALFPETQNLLNKIFSHKILDEVNNYQPQIPIFLIHDSVLVTE